MIFQIQGNKGAFRRMGLVSNMEVKEALRQYDDGFHHQQVCYARAEQAWRVEPKLPAASF